MELLNALIGDCKFLFFGLTGYIALALIFVVCFFIIKFILELYVMLKDWKSKQQSKFTIGDDD